MNPFRKSPTHFLYLTLLITLLASLLLAAVGAESSRLYVANQWNALIGPSGTGTDGIVRALPFDGSGNLYAGGAFTTAGGVTVNGVAKWDGTGWSALIGPSGTGMSNYVQALAFDGSGNLYAGGNFLTAGGVTVNYVAKWDGTGWSALSGPSGTGTNNTVQALAFDGSGNLYAGGNFLTAGGVTVNHVAKWDGTSWSALSGPSGTGTDATVHALAFDGSGNLYAGGWFLNAGGVNVNRVAKWDGTGWSALIGPSNTGTNATVRALVFDGSGNLYAGGNFKTAGGVSVNNVAKWDGTGWSALIGPSFPVMDGTVYALALDGSGNLYAGGLFTTAGGGTVNHVAKWDGTNWSALSGPSGTGTNGGNVRALAVDGSGNLYAGGAFTAAGGVAVGGVAMYELALPVVSDSAAATTSNKNTGVDGSINNVNGVWLNIPAGAIPASNDANNNACRIVVEEAGEASDYGFSIDETVWDIKIYCDGAQVHNFDLPITICVRPSDGSNANKTLFHRHGGQTTFSGMPAAGGKSGWVCGSTDKLSLFLAGEYLLPNTGFAPETVTALDIQPVELAYTNTGIVLNIPKLGITKTIMGVPKSPDGWNVNWLGNGVGYLAGTAFPTWAGNTALTGHVWNADGSPGIFYGLDQLQHGDQFTITAWGLTYTYEVRDSERVYATNLSVLEHSDYDIVTLLTCEDFSEWSGEYRYRRVVTAVLVAVK